MRRIAIIFRNRAVGGHIINGAAAFSSSSLLLAFDGLPPNEGHGFKPGSRMSSAIRFRRTKQQLQQATTNRSRNNDSEVDSAVEELIRQTARNPQSSENANPLSSSPALNNNQEASTSNDVARQPPPAITVTIFDKFGMPAPPPRIPIHNVQELLGSAPDVLSKALRRHFRTYNIKELTAPQQQAIPFILEGRDVLCIAPTSSGKTLSYLIPCLMQLLSSAGHTPGSSISGDKDAQETGASPSATAAAIAQITQQQRSRGIICKFCEMDVTVNPVCSFTGHPHPQPRPTFSRNDKAEENTKTVVEPKLIILTPTNELAKQICEVARRFHSGYKIFHTADLTNANERTIDNADILVTHPLKLVTLLRKNVSLRKVQAIVMDEVDLLLSTTWFEPVKIILASLPKHEARPQRLLFGATLPPSMHEMIRKEMLLPSHRFILGKHSHSIASNRRTTRPVVASRDPQYLSPGSNNPSSTISDVAATSRITHHVLMVSKVEKIDVLIKQYESGSIRGDQRVIIFCNSRNNVQYVVDALTQRLHSCTNPVARAARAVGFSSTLSSEASTGVMKMFQSGVATVLVTTDALGRGIDFHNVMYVVHFDVPQEIEEWVHRNGRCGRHGNPGTVFTLFQSDSVRIAKPLVACLRQMGQLVPPKLVEYAKTNFIDHFKNSLAHHPTKGNLMKRSPERHDSVVGRGQAKIPDYQQMLRSRHQRPQ